MRGLEPRDSPMAAFSGIPLCCRRHLGTAILIILFPVLALPFACTGSAPQGKKSGAGEITVAAAADLYGAFTEIGALFEKDTGKRVVLSFGSTGNLATQIEGGAPFDVFAAANTDFVERLDRKGLLLRDSIQLYARGRIVLAVNKSAGLKIENLSGLLGPGVKKIAMANPAHAPYGLAAQQALQSEGIWELINPKLVYGENVRQALIYVQRGEAEAGIVALSVAGAPEINYVLIDDKTHQPLNQALAVISSTKEEKTAREFIAYVNGKGRSAMKKYGFLLPGEFTE